jgi:hypothetical protein
VRSLGLCRRLRALHAELVTLRGSQGDPAGVRRWHAGSQSGEPLGLGVSVGGYQVQVDADLDDPGLGYELEPQSRHAAVASVDQDGGVIFRIADAQAVV